MVAPTIYREDGAKMKNAFKIVAVMLLITAVGVISYNCGLSNGEVFVYEDTTYSAEGDNSIGRIDYPLIDIAFNDGNDWAVVIDYGIYNENSHSLICKDAKILRGDEEYISVLTYPAGYGTTGDGCFNVYKNGVLIKEVEFFSVSFGKDEIRNKFEKQAKPYHGVDLGSFTFEMAYSYDGKFYAVQNKTAEKDYINVSIYETDSNECVFSITPARASDFWGICWEKGSYNIWIQSADVGILCYEYENGEWSLNLQEERPEYIKSKYD